MILSIVYLCILLLVTLLLCAFCATKSSRHMFFNKCKATELYLSAAMLLYENDFLVHTPSHTPVCYWAVQPILNRFIQIRFKLHHKPVLYAVKGILQTEVKHITLRGWDFPERRTRRHTETEPPAWRRSFPCFRLL